MGETVGILVVDDETVVGDLLQEILSSEGYAVQSCSGGPEALRRMREGLDITLLVTDLMMPEMDGLTLIHEARRLRPDIIPMLMTGHATLETARAAVREGAYDYLLKPFGAADVRLAVAKALDRRRLLEENARLRQLADLFHFSETVSSFAEEKALLQFVFRTALERVDADRGSLMVALPNRQALAMTASTGLPQGSRDSVVDFGAGIAGWVAENGEPLMAHDLRDDPDMEARSLRLDHGSFISVPLERRRPGVNGEDGRVLAVLNVSRKRNGGTFTESDLRTLRIVANQAASALENVRLVHDVANAHLSTLQSMALMLEARDAYTHGHSQRVRHYCTVAARSLGMSDDEIEKVELGAALHDIGKIGVGDGVLNKPGRLDAEEFAVIRRHPLIGFDVLSPVAALTPEHLEIVRSHHERLDGSGYPDRLPGDRLSARVRLIAVADAYDAMSSDRAYRPALPPARIVEELERGAGTQFDPDVAQQFARLIASGALTPEPERSTC